MQALTIRIARAVNRALERRGTVFADRYHAHVLRTWLLRIGWFSAGR